MAQRGGDVPPFHLLQRRPSRQRGLGVQRWSLEDFGRKKSTSANFTGLIEESYRARVWIESVGTGSRALAAAPFRK